MMLLNTLAALLFVWSARVSCQGTSTTVATPAVAPNGVRIELSELDPGQFDFTCKWSNTTSPVPSVVWAGARCQAKGVSYDTCRTSLEPKWDNGKMVSCNVSNSAGSLTASHTINLQPRAANEPQIKEIEVNGSVATTPTVCVKSKQVTIRCTAENAQANNTVVLVRWTDAQGCSEKTLAGYTESDRNATCGHFPLNQVLLTSCEGIMVKEENNNPLDKIFTVPVPPECSTTYLYICGLFGNQAVFHRRMVQVALDCSPPSTSISAPTNANRSAGAGESKGPGAGESKGGAASVNNHCGLLLQASAVTLALALSKLTDALPRLM